MLDLYVIFAKSDHSVEPAEPGNILKFLHAMMLLSHTYPDCLFLNDHEEHSSLRLFLLVRLISGSPILLPANCGLRLGLPSARDATIRFKNAFSIRA